MALVGVALTILAGFVKRVATDYTITDRRLNIKRGIVSRTIQETRLERVQNVNYNQSVVQRMLQIGDVDFDTAAGDDYNFVFERRRRARGRRPHGRPGHAVARRARRPRRRGRPAGRQRREPHPSAAERQAERGRLLAGARAPAASRSASARSVRSQVKSWSSRPKWP